MSLSATERLNVRGLFDRYAWAYDCADAEAYADTFLPHGVVIGSDDVRAEGREAIVKFVQAYLDRAQGELWQHRMNNYLFEGSGDSCTAYAYWTMLHRMKGEQKGRVLGFGYYAARCEKSAGAWYFRELLIRHWDGKRIPWKTAS